MNKYNKAPRNYACEERLAGLARTFPEEHSLLISKPTGEFILQTVYEQNDFEFPLNPTSPPRLVIAQRFCDLAEQARYRGDHTIIILKRGTLLRASDLLHELAHSVLWGLIPRPEVHGEEFVLTYGILYARYLLDSLCGHQNSFVEVANVLKIDVPKVGAQPQTLPEP